MGGLVGFVPLVARPCLVQRLPPAGWWDWVMKPLTCGTAGPDQPIQASSGSLVGRLRVQKSLGLLPVHLWVKPGLRVSARLLAGKAGSWSLVAGPRDPRAGVKFLSGQDGGWGGCAGSSVSRSLCWPASGQGPSPAGLRTVSGLL